MTDYKNLKADRVLLPPHPFQRGYPQHHAGRDHRTAARAGLERVLLRLEGSAADRCFRGILRVL